MEAPSNPVVYFGILEIEENQRRKPYCEGENTTLPCTKQGRCTHTQVVFIKYCYLHKTGK